MDMVNTRFLTARSMKDNGTISEEISCGVNHNGRNSVAEKNLNQDNFGSMF